MCFFHVNHPAAHSRDLDNIRLLLTRFAPDIDPARRNLVSGHDRCHRVAFVGGLHGLGLGGLGLGLGLGLVKQG